MKHMALVSDKLRGCGIKIKTSVSGVGVTGSGILYLTPNLVSYNYILTAKHLFQEDSQTDYSKRKVGNIEILYNDGNAFNRLELIKKNHINDRMMVFDEDLVIIMVNKNPEVSFRQILVSDELKDDEDKFFAWGIFAANTEDLHRFDLERNDTVARRYKMHGSFDPVKLKGMSGAGLFSRTRSVLFGIISRYPNEDFQNETVDLARISFAEINVKLKNLRLVELDTDSSYHKREIGTDVVDIHQAFINDTCLDLELARKRLSTDLMDDWFHDPLRYIDLLNQEYLFAQLREYFIDKYYVATEAEKFYVPKKKFTLRLALVSPFIDRIMYMACVGTLAPKLDSAQISNVYSARYNTYNERNLILNGVEQWKKMQYQLVDVVNRKDSHGDFIFNCVIEIDLLNFYDNISKDLLHQKILRICDTDNERKAAFFLKEIIGRFTSKDVGLPQNSDASALLASFYLNQVDIFMQHHAPEYFRFMDDIRIFCKDKFEARKILQTFEFELRRCYLSVNSQKTEIFSIVNNLKDNETAKPGQMNRADFVEPFDMATAKISRYRKSDNFQYRNEAFHSAIKLLKDNLWEKDDKKGDAAKKLNFALNTIAMLASRGLDKSTLSIDILETLAEACAELVDRPWITTELCKVLSLLPTDIIREFMLKDLKEVVLNEHYNTYAFQVYQIWMLLAKHKINLVELKSYAVRQIEKNDDTNKAVIAAMVIYLCSVDLEYRRVILRKYGEDFTHGYFQNRVALVALRSFRSDIVLGRTEPSLTESHRFSNRYKNRDLVFVRGFDEFDENGGDADEQLYSF